MDNQKQLINEIKMSLCDILNPEQVKKVEEVLYVKLSRYDLSEKSTEIATLDDISFQLLKMFAVEKSTEGLSEYSIRRYYQQCQKILLAINKPVKDITTFDIRNYLTSYKIRNGISNVTLDGMRLCINNFFSWLAKEKLIPENPCAIIAPIKYEKKVKKPFSNADMEKIKRACKTKRDRALTEFLYATGCRVSEITKLNRDDVDFQNRTAIVHGKGNKERIVYINEVAMMYLVEYLENRTDPYPALFIGRGSERLTKDGIEHALRRIGERAGVDGTYPHRYRRTLATNMLDRGANIQDVQTILGHNDIKTTRIYCYTTQENVKIAYDKYVS